MAITQSLASSFRRELMAGIHDFSVDAFKCMLFAETALIVGSHGPGSPNYAALAADEVVGTNYVAGGVVIVPSAPVLSGNVALVDFTDAVFPMVTLTTRGCAIYNTSKANRLVGIWDFGSDKHYVGSNCTLQFPLPNAATAIIRIS